jgi:hypothetical protein
MKIKLFQTIKTLLLLTTLTLSNGIYATSIDNDNTAQKITSDSKKQNNVYKFELNLWSPDQLAPVGAKPAEVGGNYFYLYNPDVIAIEPEQDNRIIEFAFHPSLGKRYQFRWLSADNPQYLTLKKMKHRSVKVKLNDGVINDDIYFEVWVYDTLTGEVFMCDPQMINKGKY